MEVINSSTTHFFLEVDVGGKVNGKTLARFPREVVHTFSLETLKVRPDGALSNWM